MNSDFMYILYLSLELSFEYTLFNRPQSLGGGSPDYLCKSHDHDCQWTDLVMA